ncbi:UNVERIFIED_CONTAM: hypothetical protein K2H54_032758 [Gekko kuhli]
MRCYYILHEGQDHHRGHPLHQINLYHLLTPTLPNTIDIDHQLTLTASISSARGPVNTKRVIERVGMPSYLCDLLSTFIYQACKCFHRITVNFPLSTSLPMEIAGSIDAEASDIDTFTYTSVVRMPYAAASSGNSGLCLL